MIADQELEFDNPIVSHAAAREHRHQPRRPRLGDRSRERAGDVVRRAETGRVILADKPVRLQKRVPRPARQTAATSSPASLTCRVGNRRRAAPKRAILDVFSRIGVEDLRRLRDHDGARGSRVG